MPLLSPKLMQANIKEYESNGSTDFAVKLNKRSEVKHYKLIKHNNLLDNLDRHLRSRRSHKQFDIVWLLGRS